MPRFLVKRSIVISAAPEKVFEVVADFHSWPRWSPWLCVEPDTNISISGDGRCVGDIYHWQGEIVGEGEVEHKHLESDRLIQEELRFLKPFRSRADVGFQLEPVGTETRITWTMQGSLPWFLFWMVSMMKTYLEMDYDRGLKMLKELIETGDVLSQTVINGVEKVGPLQMAGLRRQCTFADVGSSMEATFREAQDLFARNGLPTDGGMISVYHCSDLKKRQFDYCSGFILAEEPAYLPEELSRWPIPKSKALHVQHTGRYDNLGNAWSAAYQYIRFAKLKPRPGGSYEIYRNDPDQTATADLLTDLYLPLR